jgi:hypothetical protein
MRRAGDVEQHPSPPHDDRCDGCQRHAIDVRRIETGLRELVDATAPCAGWPFDLSDVLGGEA